MRRFELDPGVVLHAVRDVPVGTEIVVTFTACGERQNYYAECLGGDLVRITARATWWRRAMRWMSRLL